MLIIGERINSSRKPIAQAISRKDADFLIEQARLQIESGAHFIDVNCAVSLEKEKDDLIWLIKTLQDNLKTYISIDSPNSEVIDQALKIHKGKPFINSITAESKKLKRMLPILEDNDAFIIALTMDDSGIPGDIEGRIKLGKGLVDSLKQDGINPDNIYIDPLVKPISSEPDQAKMFLEAVKVLKQEGIKTIGGLSNVSYGLPARRTLNVVFFFLAKNAGIDAVIIDSADTLMEMAVKEQDLPFSEETLKLAEEALLGMDAYCANYIKAFRERKLNG